MSDRRISQCLDDDDDSDEKLEQWRVWQEQDGTTVFSFLISKNVNSERLIALMPTLVRWWEWIRANFGAGVEVKEEKMGDAAQGPQWWGGKDGVRNIAGN